VILPGGRFQVFVATRPVDFRKGMDGLAAVVQQQLRLDPFCGAVFVFRARRADRVKLLVWDGSGLTPDLQAARPGEVRLAADRGRGDAAVAGPARRAVRGARLEAGAQPSGAPAAARAMTLRQSESPALSVDYKTPAV
jgi:transposase